MCKATVQGHKFWHTVDGLFLLVGFFVYLYAFFVCLFVLVTLFAFILFLFSLIFFSLEFCGWGDGGGSIN